MISSSDVSHDGRQLHPRKQLSKRMINNPLTQSSNSQKEEVDRAFEELARLIVPQPAAAQPPFNTQPFMRPALNQPGPYGFRRPFPPPPFLPRPVHPGLAPLHPPHGPPPPPHSPLAPPPPKASEQKKEDKDDSSDKEESEPEDKEESEGKKKEEEKEEEEPEESNGAKKEKED